MRKAYGETLGRRFQARCVDQRPPNRLAAFASVF
jgi:hypothetical protein